MSWPGRAHQGGQHLGRAARARAATRPRPRRRQRAASAPRNRTIARRAVVTAMGSSLPSNATVYSRVMDDSRRCSPRGRPPQAGGGRSPGDRAQRCSTRSTRWARCARRQDAAAGSTTIDGFDCPSCAWPDPEHRSTGRVLRERGEGSRLGGDPQAASGPTSSPRTRSPSCATKSDHWLEANGRLTEPMYLAAGDTHYRPICWNAALTLLADRAAGAAGPEPGRRSTPADGRATRPRSSTSCSRASSAPTTCPTARTCATSRPGSR